jgi:TonB family protein
MKISPLQPRFNKPLLIGIIASALLHLSVLFSYLLWGEDEDKKSVKEEHFIVPLSVFAQQSSDAPKESVETAPQEHTQEIKRENPTPKPLHVKNKIETKPLFEAPTHNLTPQKQGERSETKSEATDKQEQRNHTASAFDSALQSEPIVLNANTTDQSALFMHIQKEITKRVLYPEAARKMKYEGITRFKFELLKDGTIKQVSITKSSEYASLDEAVLVAVKKASKHFPEVTKDYTIVMEIDFKLMQ